LDGFLRFAFRFRLVFAFHFLAMFLSSLPGFGRRQRQTRLRINDSENLPGVRINPSHW
jgi:hypothetical protein